MPSKLVTIWKHSKTDEPSGCRMWFLHCGWSWWELVCAKLHLGLLSKKNIFAHPLHNNNFTSQIFTGYQLKFRNCFCIASSSCTNKSIDSTPLADLLIAHGTGCDALGLTNLAKDEGIGWLRWWWNPRRAGKDVHHYLEDGLPGLGGLWLGSSPCIKPFWPLGEGCHS